MPEGGSRIECALANMLNEVDKEYLRQLQAEMHKCAAKCCEDRESSVEFVHDCIEKCNHNLRKAQKVVQMGFFELEKQLQKCAITCNDEAKRVMTQYPIENQIKQYSASFDRCVDKCIDANISMIPLILKKMKEVLETDQLLLDRGTLKTDFWWGMNLITRKKPQIPKREAHYSNLKLQLHPTNTKLSPSKPHETNFSL